MTRLSARRVTAVVLIAATGSMLLAGCRGTASAGTAGGPLPAGRPTAATTDTTPAAAATGGGNPPDACGLISEADASTAIGAPSGPGVANGSPDAPQCLYGNGVLIIDVVTAARADYDALHSTMTVGPAGSWQDVSGLGDAAFEVSGGPSALVYFYQGTLLIEIILGGRLAPPVDAAITVARAASAGV